MSATLLDCASPRWLDFVTSAPHDFYHLPAYAALSAAHERGQGCAVLVESARGALLLPLVVRSISNGGDSFRDAVSPYGYPGPLVRVEESEPASRAAVVAESAHEAVALLREAGIVSAFVRLHPVLNADVTEMGIGTVVTHGETVAIDLAQSSEELWRATRHGHRYEIAAAERAGMRVKIDESWAHLDDFVRLYDRTMRRVGASSFYFFPREYFCALRDALGARMHLAVVIAENSGNQVIAAGLFSECAGIVQYHLSAMDEAYAAASPTKLLVHSMREWARARGNRTMHLGGGVGAGQDSLFRFKAGFSPARLSYRTWRIVSDGAAYAALALARAPHVDAADRGGFFPAYRSPAPREPAP